MEVKLVRLTEIGKEKLKDETELYHPVHGLNTTYQVKTSIPSSHGFFLFLNDSPVGYEADLFEQVNTIEET